MTDSQRADPVLTPFDGPDEFAAAFNVSRETIARLETYVGLLRQWQKAVNLVAPSTLGAVWARHIADSAQLALLAPDARTWVDLGSGAGFPALVVAILRAGRAGEASARPQFTLIESNARKCAFLRDVVRQTGLDGRVAVDILSTRIESAATQATLRGPDVVSARALAPLDKLLALAAPLFASRTVGLFLKGRGLSAELKAAESLWTFDAELIPSRTEREGRIAAIRNLKGNHEGMKP
jgi:16S rRNA (guanine527-N7)-methyltransferase